MYIIVETQRECLGIDGIKLALVIPTGSTGKEVSLETVEKPMTEENYGVD
jgi:hypothetical protein